MGGASAASLVSFFFSEALLIEESVASTTLCCSLGRHFDTANHGSMSDASFVVVFDRRWKQ